MISLRGGPHAPGTNSFVVSMLDKYISRKDILSSHPPPPCGIQFMLPEASVLELSY
jgi:hypothetical protein